MKAWLISLLVATVSFSAIAAQKIELQKCAVVGASLESMMFGASNQKTFYSGNVGLVAFDTIEPAAASYGIAILSYEPIETEIPVRRCLAIPYLSGVDLSKSTSIYNAKTGLLITVPVKKMTAEGRQVKATVQISIKSVNAGTLS